MAWKSTRARPSRASCQRELPEVEKVWEDSDGRYNVVSVATAQGSRPASAEYADAEAFIKTAGLTMPTIDDPDDKLGTAWGVDSFPKLYVLDANLNITAVPQVGTSNAQLEQMLTSG